MKPNRELRRNRLRTKQNLRVEVGGNVNWYSHYGEQYGNSIFRIFFTTEWDPAIPLLGIDLGKNRIQKDTRTPVLTAARLQQPGHGSNLNIHRQRNG